MSVWRARCRETGTPGSGGGTGETDQPRGWHRAPGRPHWATDALDEVRRETWNTARKEGLGGHARDLKHARYALWKNPEDLTEKQAAKLAWVAKVNHRLYRAYLLKEQLRQVFALKGEDGKRLLDHWLAWARRCRIPLSSTWPSGSPSTASRSTPASSTGCPTGWSRARTPRCVS